MGSRMKRMMVAGVVQVLLGCLVGLIPPPAVLHFRSVVTAHLEFTANGTLLAVLGLLVPYMNLGSTGFLLFEALAYLGTFFNGAAFLISATTGFGTHLTPMLHEKHPYPMGLQGAYSDAITNMLMGCAVTIILCLVLAVIGLVSHPSAEKRTKKA